MHDGSFDIGTRCDGPELLGVDARGLLTLIARLEMWLC